MIPVLHLVTDDEVLSRAGFVETARRALEAGGADLALHLRGPGTRGRALFSLAQGLLPVARATGGLLLANDRVDLALALDLPGVQLGQRSLPPAVARRLLGPGRLLGLSVHGREEAAEGGAGHVDFFLVGTLFPSASHPGVVPGGRDRLLEVRDSATVPLVGIGGITPDRAARVLEWGAHGVAVRSGIWDTTDPSSAVRGYLMEMGRGART